MLSQLSHRSGLPSLIGRINQTLPGPNPDGSAGYYGGGAGILGNVSKAGHTLADIIGSPNQMLAGPQQSGQAGYMGGGSGLLGFLSGILSGNG